MSNNTTAVGSAVAFNDWIDPLEQALREGVQRYLQELLEHEVNEALGRLRYARGEPAKGYRHGRRARKLIGPFSKAGSCRNIGARRPRRSP